MKTDVEMFSEIGPGFKSLVTEILNAIVDAQDNGKPTVVVVFQLSHETKRIEMTIYDSGEPPAGMGYLN